MFLKLTKKYKIINYLNCNVHTLIQGIKGTSLLNKISWVRQGMVIIFEQ